MTSSAPARASGPTKTEIKKEKKAVRDALEEEKKGVTTTDLRVHSPEAVLPRGKVLEDWSVCTKPRTGGVGGGCRNGLMGYFVRTEDGVLKRVVWVGKKGGGAAGVCDWEGGEGEEDEGEDEE